MALRTKTDLATAAMQKVGLLNATETPSAEDASYIRKEYDDKLEELRDDGLVYWPNTGIASAEIPNAVFPALVKIMGAEIGSAFGLPFDAALMAEGMSQLRKHLSKGASGEVVDAQYF